MPRDFDLRRFSTTSEMVTGHLAYLHDEILVPFMTRLQPVVRALRKDVLELTSSFLGRPPVPASHGVPQTDFYAQSKKRDVATSLRRFALGFQTRGLHLRMREAATMEDHLYFAQQLAHPHCSCASALEPDWLHVFTQLTAAFREQGVPHALMNLNDYRFRMIQWMTTLRDQVQSLQRELNQHITTHAVKVQTVLLYFLLVVVDYPNPELAWRFFHGSPIVGEFFSAALKERVRVNGQFDDVTIRKVAVDCYRTSRASVKNSLSPAAATKAMAKTNEEFESKTLKGPFDTPEQLRQAMQEHIRSFRGFENFVVPPDMIIISPQFTIAELHAYEEAVKTAVIEGQPEEELEYKIRNIFNARKMNELTQSLSTYVPNTHGDVSVIIIYYVGLLVNFGFDYTMLGWPSDFAKAYRQMPIPLLQVLFAGTCYWDYDVLPRPGRQRYGFYTSLPFGSSLAPAGWGELVVALAFIMARLLLAIITHCVDDVANFEPEETVSSARSAFIQICELLGLTLDMVKSLTPRAEFIYLGLELLLPSSVGRRELCLRITEARCAKLLAQIRKILDEQTLTSGDASSMRGRLYFYAAWYQESRTYLAELAARQYSEGHDVRLTFDLHIALKWFESMLQCETFLVGIRPQRILGDRPIAWLYTDGMKNDPSDRYPHGEKGIGGVCFPGIQEPPLWYGEHLNPRLHGFDFIAAIEMYAVLRALRLFGRALQGKAVFMFIDNTHAVGCLLRRSASVRERVTSTQTSNLLRSRFRTPQEEFEALCPTLREAMNVLARRIWSVLAELDCIVWIEYVWTKVNLADPPSRGEPPPMPTGPGFRVGESFETEVDTF